VGEAEEVEMKPETQQKINELKFRIMQSYGGHEKEKKTNRVRLKKEIAKLKTQENKK